MESNVLAYIRQTGSKLLNKRGLKDFLLAIVGPISENELGALVDHHSLSKMINTFRKKHRNHCSSITGTIPTVHIRLSNDIPHRALRAGSLKALELNGLAKMIC